MTNRLLPILLVLLGMALPAAAQTPAPPRFLLESVVVEGVQRDAVREIVAAESLLQLGKEYTEQELREAVYRVKRLPFVLDAEFSLRKGGERGSYQLVITVEETRLVFFSASAGGLYLADGSFGPDEDHVDWGASATVGGRWFVGSQGIVFASVQGYDEVGPAAAQAGYTHYNLFGRGGFASVALSTDISDEYDADSYQGTFSVGIPIVGNHSVRADLDWFRTEQDDALFGSFQDDSRRLGVSWIYDTTDDPLFPVSGARVSGSAAYNESERESRFQGLLVKNSSDGYDLGLTGSRYWTLTPRQSIGSHLTAYWSTTDFGFGETDYWSASAVLSHSMDLWGFEKTERLGDFRWESSLQIRESESDAYYGRFSSTEGQLSTGLAFRNAWGVTRLSFTYVDNLDQESRFRDVL